MYINVILLLPLFVICFTSSAYSENFKHKNYNVRLNECGSCKLLVKSFDYWLQKTSRGKFDGGDAHWEENKLKSYSKSEIRLAEVQEGLCTELKKYQNDCYSAVEHSEALIEQWWSLNDPDEGDLSTWLCIESLEVCCPRGHYGPNCSECIKCEGNTRCDGEGTRQGTGQCNCSKGFKLEDGVCNPVNLCHPSACEPGNFCRVVEGKKQCSPCHSACKKCSGPRRMDCTECPYNYVHSYSGACINSHTPDSIQIYTTMMIVLPLAYMGLKLVSLVFKSRYVYFIAFQVIFIAVHYYYGFIHLFLEFIYDFLEYSTLLSLW